MSYISLAEFVCTSLPNGPLYVCDLYRLAEVSWKNACVLSYVHENDPSLKSLFLGQGPTGESIYCVEHLRDISCLGLLMRNNTKISILGIRDDMLDYGDFMIQFFIALHGNNSIRKLTVLSATLTDNSDALSNFHNLATFIKSHKPLAAIDLTGLNMPVEAWRALPRTLEERAGRSLQEFMLNYCDIGDEEMSDVIIALSAHQQLKLLQHKTRSACRATYHTLAFGLKDCFSNLITLDVDGPYPDLAHIVQAIPNGSKIRKLILSDSFFESAASEKWPIVKKLLCDTSSIEKTFFSNHTVSRLSHERETRRFQVPSDIQFLLDLNCRENKSQVSKMKIVQHHFNFDLRPLFCWNLKALPLILEWLEAASSCHRVEWPEATPDYARRKLSVLYQFSRTMPMYFVKK